MTRGIRTLLLLPYGAMLAAILLVPLCILVTVSFATYAPSRLWDPTWTTANYERLFGGFYLAMLLNTLRIGVIATVVTALIGYPVAYFLARTSRSVATLGIFLLVAPLMVSVVIRSFGWMVILGRGGPVAEAMKLFGVESRSGALYTEAAVIVGFVQILLPLMVLPILGAIERIPVRLEEAAASLGASPLRTFGLVILPLSRSGLVSGMILSFTVAVSAVITPALLGGRQVRMAGNFIYEQVLSAFNWPFGASIANVLAAISLACMVVLIAAGRPPSRRREGGPAGA